MNLCAQQRCAETISRGNDDGDAGADSKSKLNLYFTSKICDCLDLFNLYKSARSKYAMTTFNSRGKYEKFPVLIRVPQTTQNLVISRCYLAVDGKETHKDLQRTCTVIVLQIQPFVWWRSRCCRRGLLKLPK